MTDRRIQQLLFFFSMASLLASFYLQYGLKLEPCPLCIMQRLCVMLITVTTAVGLIFPQVSTSKAYWILQFSWLAAGLYFVFRQLWLQSLPPNAVPACMPALNILMAYFPVSMILKALFWGGGSCAVVKFHLLGLSLATWSAIYFILTAGLLIIALRAKHEG
jgi:disulfide bond formation protein DsbB